MATTLILGGGFGGISTAVELRKLAPKDHRIVLVDNRGAFAFGAAKTWVALGEMSSPEAVYPLSALQRKGIEVVQAEVQSIDPKAKRAATSGGERQGDFLVIALGAIRTMEGVPGMAESAETYYTMEGAERLRGVLSRFKGGKVVHLIPRSPFSCPPGPYEGAFLLHDYFQRHSIPVEESFYTVEGAPMATAGPAIGAFVREELAKRSIAYHPSKKTERVEQGKVAFEGGEEAPFDLLVAVPVHLPPQPVKECGLAGPSGWIPADPKTLAVAGHPGVYAIGDVSVVSLPGRFKPDAPLVLPKAGVMADAQGQVVAAHIAAACKGGRSNKAFDGKGFCYLEMGDMHAMRGDGEFYRLPHPDMARRVPDMQQYLDKQRWVTDWLKRHLE